MPKLKTVANSPTLPERLRLKIAYRKVDDLNPYAGNARMHSDKQITQIAASIRQFGFTNPVLIDGADGIVAGHGRVAAARTLGLAEVPVAETDQTFGEVALERDGETAALSMEAAE